MTFAEHLEELRKRVMISVIVIGVLFFASFFLHDQTLRVFISPFERVRANLLEEGIEIGPLTFIDPTESFTFALKVALYSALILGGPVCLYEMWAFIAAGLHLRERRAVMKVLPVSLGLFSIGVLFCYFLVVPIALEFLLSFAPHDQIQADIRLETYLSFITMLCLLMGGIFQLPLLQVVVARFGLLSAKSQREKRKAFIMAAVVVCAIVTPTGDALTLILVAGPMLILYELGLIAAGRVKARPQEG
jgi:sec-independent protein translocase protein TatC